MAHHYWRGRDGEARNFAIDFAAGFALLEGAGNKMTLRLGLAGSGSLPHGVDSPKCRLFRSGRGGGFGGTAALCASRPEWRRGREIARGHWMQMTASRSGAMLARAGLTLQSVAEARLDGARCEAGRGAMIPAVWTSSSSRSGSSAVKPRIPGLTTPSRRRINTTKTSLRLAPYREHKHLEQGRCIGLAACNARAHPPASSSPCTLPNPTLTRALALPLTLSRDVTLAA